MPIKTIILRYSQVGVMMGQKSQTFLSYFTKASLQCDITLTWKRKILLTISMCQVRCMGRCTCEIT